MATIAYEAAQLQTLFGHTWRVTWPLMANGDEGQVWEQSCAADRSVQVKGTFGAGGNCKIEGTNEACHEPTATPTYAVLHDPQGNALDQSAASIEAVTEATAGIRPRISAGDATTSLTVTMLVRSVV